jgi:hypothetical protein
LNPKGCWGSPDLRWRTSSIHAGTAGWGQVNSFTIPKAEYATIDQLKQRAATSGLPSKKSEVLRAGLMALAGMGDAAFQAAMSAVPTLKTGRPKKA